MIVADASFWVSSLVPVDVYHSPSREFAGRWANRYRPISIPAIFFAEVSGTLTRNRTLSDLSAAELYESLESPLFAHHPIDAALERLAAEVAHSASLRGADAIYVALASQLSLPLVTWDKEQLERGGQIVRTLTPEQAMEELL